MKHQDNFNTIRSLLSFPDTKDIFFHIELIGRKKDNPELTESQKSYGSYFVTSLAMFDAIKDEIVRKCVDKKCRAYINLNPKSKKAVGFTLMHKLMTMAENDDFTNLFSLMTSAAGTVNGVKGSRTFIIDVDDCDNSVTNAVDEVKDIIDKCKRPDMAVSPYVGFVKTASGFHVITTPFDVSDFNKRKSGLKSCTAEVKTNSPTLLFVSIA